MLKLILAAILFSCVDAKAFFDLKIGGQGRSYPSFGGDANLTLGLNIPLWGEIEKGKIAYGALRFQSELSSSVVVYHQDSSVTFYPISFIGFGAGHKHMTSNYEEFTFYDCSQVRCVGEMKKDYAFGKMILGWGPWLVSFAYKESRNTYTDPDNTGHGVAEYEYTTIVDPESETSTHRTYFLGMRIGGNILGALSQNVYFNGSGQEFHSNIVFYNMGFDQLKMTIGGGALYSTEQKPGAMAIFSLSYAFWENKALF